MGRTKYSEAERDKIIVMFISAAREVIETEGLRNVTVRKVADIANCNSSLLYFYFNDVDELVTMASMSYLEKYTKTLAADLKKLDNDYDIFIHTWEVFTFYALNNPVIFNQIFFKDHKVDLRSMISEYYRLFPAQLDTVNESVKKMLFQGSLAERNMDVLIPLAENGYIHKDNLELVNELMLSYFREILDRSILSDGGMIEIEEMRSKFMAAVRYLIDKEKSVKVA